MNLIINHIITSKAKAKYKELGLSEELISIYLKHKKYRTTKDNTYLIQNFEHFSCFQTILNSYKEGELMLETIFKKLDFKIFEPGKIIYSPNDIISNMFYVFYGSVKIDKNKINTLASTSYIKSYVKNCYNKSKSKQIDNDNALNKRGKNFLKLGFAKKLIKAIKKVEYFNENDNLISKGDEYGFDDIRNKSLRRRDLVETTSTCIIGFLSKEDWINIFEKTDLLKKNDILKFLQNLQILKNWTNDKMISHIYNSMTERNINIGETLIKFGQEFTKFYIIRKGFFQVEIKLKSKIKNCFNDIDSFGNYNDKERTDNIKYEAKNFYIKEENYKIITYGKGEFLGDIEYYLNSKKYLTKILCKSNSALVYEINYDDLITNSAVELKKLLMKEGKAKLEYFNKRIQEMKILNNSKIRNKNKYKQIILKKLEEEKGKIFTDMENKKNGLLLYEKKRRKRLKTASLNLNNVKNNNLYENNLYNNIKSRNKTENNYLTSFTKTKNQIQSKFIFPTSVKKDKINLKLTQLNWQTHNNKKGNNSNDIITTFDTFASKANISKNNNNENHVKFKVKSENKILKLFNVIKNPNFNINNIEIINRLKSHEMTNIKTPKKDVMRIISSKNFVPQTPNDKLLKAFTYLYKNEEKRKKNIQMNEANGINCFNTQEYSFLKTSDKSLNDNNNTNSNNNTLSLIKKENNVQKINFKGKMPLLTEVVRYKKKIVLKGFYTNKIKNYNVNCNI